MKERYAVMTKLPDCPRAKPCDYRCSGCKIGEILLFDDESCWFGSDNFALHCHRVNKENVKFISKELGEKLYMTQKL